jgi:uncharacterized protein (DUF433 family)
MVMTPSPLEMATTREQKLIDKYIEPNPYRPGVANARIAGYGVSIWAIVGHLEAVNGDIEQVADDYGLPCEAVEASLAYYRQHRELIDARLAVHGS